MPLDYIITTVEPSMHLGDEEDIMIPEEFVCPLTLEIMKEPVMTRWGHNFERDVIMKWMEQRDHCPMTRNPISLKDVIINRALKAKILTWKRIHMMRLTVSDISDEDVDHDADQTDINDRILPFLVDVDSTQVMIQALKGTQDPTGKFALKQLRRQEREENHRLRQQRAALAA